MDCRFAAVACIIYLMQEPQSQEEYIAHVERQAEQQGEEPSHSQILEQYECSKKEYRQKANFYIFLLAALIAAYLASRYWKDIKHTVGIQEL